MQVYAILRGLAKSAYWPIPQLFISVDTVITVPSPTSNLPSGTYQGPLDVELSCEMVAATIHYTLDGGTPTSDSPPYISGSPITISESTTLRARAFAPNYNNSNIVEFKYIIT